MRTSSSMTQYGHTQQTQDVEPMLVWCCANIKPALVQRLAFAGHRVMLEDVCMSRDNTLDWRGGFSTIYNL